LSPVPFKDKIVKPERMEEYFFGTITDFSVLPSNMPNPILDSD
jgi:hypothetical protein